MLLLPKGNPVKESIDPSRINIPEAFAKLARSSFTGYLRFDTTRGTGILIFNRGRLISALLESGSGSQIAYDALAAIFECSLSGNVVLNIYRLSPELALGIHALLHGDVLYQAQEVKLLDIKALLGKLKQDKVTGCLRIYTQEHVALIFYREGTPLGFFHDGSTEIEKTAENSMSVAKLPGAKIDVLAAVEADEQDLADLLTSGDVGAIWAKAKQEILQERQVRDREASRAVEMREADRRSKVEELFKSVATKHIGKIGTSLVEKEFEKTFVGESLVTEKGLNGFYQRLCKASRLVAGPSAVKAMLDEMQRGFQGLGK
ncbi:MAG: GTPase-activating protein [Desulfuromonas sp.]|nr:MAG: GTPase-activating protein [Desulfuromonas sp.]